MLKAFKQKALEVCSEDRCLAPHGIVAAVAAKVDSLIEKDEETGEYLVGIDLKVMQNAMICGNLKSILQTTC